MEVKIPTAIQRDFEHLIDLHRKHGAPNPMKNTNNLIRFILATVAKGSKNPGSREGVLLEIMGIVPNRKAHNDYRHHYGNPDEIKLCERFWKTYQKLEGLSGTPSINFSPDVGFIMINLNYFTAQCDANNIEHLDLTSLKRALIVNKAPLFIEKNRSVWHKTMGKTFKCWVFKK